MVLGALLCAAGLAADCAALSAGEELVLTEAVCVQLAIARVVNTPTDNQNFLDVADLNESEDKQNIRETKRFNPTIGIFSRIQKQLVGKKHLKEKRATPKTRAIALLHQSLFPVVSDFQKHLKIGRF
jgi:hypothetical protein